MYKTDPELLLFLVHPGGPYFRKKDKGWWTIPKGEPEPQEALLTTACREFQEETGIKPTGPYIPLDFCMQKGGKQVWAWAFQGDWQEADGLVSNTFPLEWPPRSGKIVQFPEVDRAAWFKPEDAKNMINAAQQVLIDRLQERLPY